MTYCKLYQHNFGHLSLIHHSSLQVLTMQSTTEAHREEPPSPPQLPFRSLSELMTEHFQAYGSSIRIAILEGVKEINNDIPYPQQTLRAQAIKLCWKRVFWRYISVLKKMRMCFAKRFCQISITASVGRQCLLQSVTEKI